MAGIISAISVVIVEKLADNSVFAQKVAECLVQSGFNATVKQDIYEACDMNLKEGRRGDGGCQTPNGSTRRIQRASDG